MAIILNLENVTIRPQIFSVLLFAAELVLLWNSPRRWAPVAIGLLMLAWTNLHGIFVLGVALPWIFLAGSALPTIRSSGWPGSLRDPMIRNYFACAVVATVAAFCNPQPLQMLDYVTQTASAADRLNLLEWHGTNLSTITGITFWCSVVICLIVYNRSQRPPSLTEWLLIAFFFLLGVKALRMVTWWSLVMAPILAAHLSTMTRAETAREPVQKNPALLYVLTCLFAAAFLSRLPLFRTYKPPADEPYAMARALEARAPLGKVFNPMEWGGFLTWEEGDRLKTFVDGRIIPYPRPVWDDYLKIIDADPDTEQLFNRYGINAVVVSKGLTPKLVMPMNQSRQWSKVYEDRLAIVYERAKAPPTPIP